MSERGGQRMAAQYGAAEHIFCPYVPPPGCTHVAFALAQPPVSALAQPPVSDRGLVRRPYLQSRASRGLIFSTALVPKAAARAAMTTGTTNSHTPLLPLSGVVAGRRARANGVAPSTLSPRPPPDHPHASFPFVLPVCHVDDITPATSAASLPDYGAREELSSSREVQGTAASGLGPPECVGMDESIPPSPPRPPSDDHRHNHNDEGDDARRLPSKGWLVLALRAYVRKLEEAPLRTKMITAGVLGAASDIIAQVIERATVGRSGMDAGTGTGSGDLDWRRVFSLAVVGAILTAPMFHALYEILDRAVPASVKGWRAWRNTAMQLAVDQLVAAPIWLVSFYALFSALETGRLQVEEFSAQIRRDFIPSMKLTWTVFPIFQVLSFALPTKLRVLVLNVVDLGYVAALSFLKHA